MKTIPLTQGKFAMIDDEDYTRTSRLKWIAVQVSGGGWYANTRIDGKIIYLHRFLLNPPSGATVDHIDGNGLNCCRSNMRICRHNQNIWNSKISKNNTTGFKGVCFDKRRGTYYAQIEKGRKKHYLGASSDTISAAERYDEAARELFGEFARTNFQQGTETNPSLCAGNSTEACDTFIQRVADTQCGAHWIAKTIPMIKDRSEWGEWEMRDIGTGAHRKDKPFELSETTDRYTAQLPFLQGESLAHSLPQPA